RAGVAKRSGLQSTSSQDLLSVRPLVAIRGFDKPGGVGVLAVMHAFCNLPRNLTQHRGRGPLTAETLCKCCGALERALAHAPPYTLSQMPAPQPTPTSHTLVHQRNLPGKANRLHRA